jgi:hypothetical protein
LAVPTDWPVAEARKSNGSFVELATVTLKINPAESACEEESNCSTPMGSSMTSVEPLESPRPYDIRSGRILSIRDVGGGIGSVITAFASEVAGGIVRIKPGNSERLQP